MSTQHSNPAASDSSLEIAWPGAASMEKLAEAPGRRLEDDLVPQLWGMVIYAQEEKPELLPLLDSGAPQVIFYQ